MMVVQSVIFTRLGPRIACSIWPPSSGRMGSMLSSAQIKLMLMRVKKK